MSDYLPPDGMKPQPLTPLEVLHCLAIRHPGLVTGEDDGTSGADVVDSIGQLLGRLDQPTLKGLKKAAGGAT